LPDLNWAGFYFRQGEELVLGPFQGKPACVRIPVGQGVCGTAAARAEVVLVPDAHHFPGHIACDPASRSELVVPLIEAGAVQACSTWTARFSAASIRSIGKAASNWFRCFSPTRANIAGTLALRAVETTAASRGRRRLPADLPHEVSVRRPPILLGRGR